MFTPLDPSRFSAPAFRPSGEPVPTSPNAIVTSSPGFASPVSPIQTSKS
jgi:hypothetical protein